uniref:Uncharacterized protein n=1 Tax=Rhipicephalus microplus TaxID=6941 RepID=A0A6G5AHN2_RHIMP
MLYDSTFCTQLLSRKSVETLYLSVLYHFSSTCVFLFLFTCPDNVKGAFSLVCFCFVSGSNKRLFHLLVRHYGQNFLHYEKWRFGGTRSSVCLPVCERPLLKVTCWIDILKEI